MQPWNRSLRTLLLCLLLPWPGAGQFQVMGPRSPVIAMVGKEAVFSCHLRPAMDAQQMEVTWYKNHQSGLVHDYRNGQEHVEQQRLEYCGRTQFLKGNISQGQVALRLQPIRTSDGGDYRCLFASSTGYSEAQFKLLVTASGQDPHIHVEPGPSGSIKLTCTSPGWYPEPEVQWSGPGQLQLEPASEANSVEGDSLFRVESSVSVEESSREHVTCSIRNPVLNEKKGHVSMAGDLFTRVSPWTVVLAVFDVLVAVSLAVISAILMRTTKAKETLSEELEERSSIGGIDLEEARRYAGYLGTFCVMKCGFARLIFWDKLELARNLCPQLLPPCHSCKMILLSSSEDITLDADTAHPSLHVSHSGKHVETLPMKQDVPDKSARFTLAPFVLGQKSFSSGLHYWEVEVPDKYTWNVGLCLDSVKRKISYNYTSPENGFWSISRIDRRYDALSVPRFVVNVENPPLKIVGIFLQYEKGLISFYDVKASSILYTFKSKFTQPLKPYFSPGPHIPGEKQAFKILQVPGGSRFL
ncbi:butyrophilin subfamily 1 member A1-like isoform X1 [Marmota flaviventris]|uniref:butyrophilin subfamily 1 member A1-like isoform X1 n=1 Tax=Marmota flaviventris TaxID=93162 RepID=UPI003A8AEB29